MKSIQSFRLAACAGALAMVAAAGNAEPVVITQPGVSITSQPGTPYSATSIDSVATGSAMAGMGVQACFFVGGCSNTLIWSLLEGEGESAVYGVTAAGWGVTMPGRADSFLTPFVLNATAGLSSLTFFGLTGGTVFDIIPAPNAMSLQEPNTGTPGSESGLPFTIDDLLVPDDAVAPSGIDVLYSDIVSLGSDQPVGDLFLTMQVTFLGGEGFVGFVGDLQFFADTDIANGLTQIPPVGPTPVSLPGSLALAGLGLALVGLNHRRRRPV